MADTKTREVSRNVQFVNYVNKDNVGLSADPGDEIDVSKLADGEEARIEAAGGFADAPLDLTRVGSDMDGRTIVDDREPTDVDTPVPPENGGVLPLDDEVSDYEASDKATLEGEVERRNASGRTVEPVGTGANDAITKADLVTALSEDDERP